MNLVDIGARLVRWTAYAATTAVVAGWFLKGVIATVNGSDAPLLAAVACIAAAIAIQIARKAVSR